MSIYAQIGNITHIRPKELERFTKFAIVGVFGSIVDFGVYNLLIPPFAQIIKGEWFQDSLFRAGAGFMTYASLPPALAGTCSFFLAIISNFVWNRYWTYPDSRSKQLLPQFLQFFIINSMGIVIRIPILALTNIPIAHLAKIVLGCSDEIAIAIGRNLALALAIGIVMLWNFFVNRRITYNDVE